MRSAERRARCGRGNTWGKAGRKGVVKIRIVACVCSVVGRVCGREGKVRGEQAGVMARD